MSVVAVLCFSQTYLFREMQVSLSCKFEVNILLSSSSKSELNPDAIGENRAKENTNSLVECTNVLLAHVADVLVVLKQSVDDEDTCTGCHGDENVVSDIESDGVDDDDESGAEESVSPLSSPSLY